ncbi:MAG: glycerophosphodiester phosphodiesterase [Lachnospiraceae bacterium]|nr:glycerophosphodiester phosphodiesterase [Lachnospiraceae bacterium]
MNMLFLLIILCAGCTLYLISIKPRIHGRPDYTPFYNYMYAHRGLHSARKSGEPLLPENSYTAIKRAADMGYGIEFDVHLTKDNVPVVFHDDTLNRICGVKGYLKDYTFAELQRFRLLGTEEKIPSFEEVLNAVGGRVPLIIEYKVEKNAGRLCSICDRILSNYNGPYCIESFHPLAVRWYKIHRPNIVRGQLSEDFTRKKLRLSYFLLSHLIGNCYAAPDFVAYNCKHRTELSRTLCRKLYRSLSVAWTVRSQEELERVSKSFDLFIFEGFVPSVTKYS